MKRKSRLDMSLYQAVKAGFIIFGMAMIDMQGPCAARGGFAAEHPMAAEHIDALPTEIRRQIFKHEQACGSKASAAHYFAVSIESGGQKFISLHFEDFVCAKRAAVCGVDGCLHEVYAEFRGRYRLVFSAHASDVKMTNDGGVVRLKIENGISTRDFKWNGRTFQSVQDSSSDINPGRRLTLTLEV